MSNGSIESSGGQTTEAFGENIIEKQTLDFTIAPEPVKLNTRPIIIVVAALSTFYLIIFIIGMAIAFGGSVNTVKDAIEFNKIMNEAIKNCKCIVSDEEWPNCSSDFCNSPKDSNVSINRNQILLHGNSTFCKNWISEKQQLTCHFYNSDIQGLEWTEWSDANADNIRYRIKKTEPYNIYYVEHLESIIGNETAPPPPLSK